MTDPSTTQIEYDDFRISEDSLPTASEFRKRMPEAVQVVETLRQAGFRAYFAGGCVRDMLLGRPFKDIDIASDASPDQVETLFARTHPIGKSFGVVQVLMNNEPFEVAAFRRDHDYTDGRRPEGYDPTTPEEDTRRRDFTVNALFLDPLEGCVLDFVGGLQDLKRGQIRAIGDASRRFKEDHLRLIRAVRFASVLEFDLEVATYAAIQQHASLLRGVSVERSRTEFVRILTEAPKAGDAVELLDSCGLLKEILPEFLELKGCTQPPEFHPEGDVWTHTVMMLNGLESPSETLALGVLLHDIGKPATRTVEDRIRFTGHAQAGAEIADQWLQRMKTSNAVRDSVVGLVNRHMNFMNVLKMRSSTLRRIIGHPDFEDELALHRLDCLCSNGITETVDRLVQEKAAYEEEAALPDPWITGRDLMEMGVPQGPEIRVWKDKAYNEQLEGRLEGPEALRIWLQGCMEQR